VDEYKILIQQENGKLSIVLSEGLPTGTVTKLLEVLKEQNLYTPSEIDGVKLDENVNF
jgi:hypothetical protein